MALAAHVAGRYGVREALSIAMEEGLEAMWERHQQVCCFI